MSVMSPALFGAIEAAMSGAVPGSGSTFRDPRSLPNLTFWLDSVESATMTGALWSDASGNGRDFVQGTAGSQPAVSTMGALNCLLFDGSNDVLTCSSAFGTRNEGTFFAIMQFVSQATNRGIFSMSDGSGADVSTVYTVHLAGGTASNLVLDIAVAGNAQLATDTSIMVVLCHWKQVVGVGGSATIIDDADLTATDSTLTGSTLSGTIAAIGARLTGVTPANFSNVKIASIGEYSRRLSTTEQVRLMAYLKAKAWIKQAFSIDEFGAVGDGITDDKVAFAKAGRHLRALGKNQSYLLDFTGGKTYWSTEGWHFTGLTRIVFEGNGATLKAPGFISGKANPYFFMQYPFFTTTDLENQLHCQTQQTPNAGHLFATVAAGATSITLTTAANASQYIAGQLVFLYGYDTYKTGGVSFPPRALYFEWLTVQSSNVGAGTVTFTTPIKYSYDSTWQDTENLAAATPYGAPRAIPWEARGAPVAVTCRNFTLVAKTPTSGFADNEGALRFPGVTVDIDNVSGADTHFVPQCAKLTTLDNCVFKFSEFDKLGELVAANGITVDQLIAGTGIKAATFQDSSFASVGYSGGDATFDNCDLGADPVIYSYFPGSVSVTGNAMNSMPVASPNFSPDQTFANGTTTYAVTDGGGVTTALTFAAGLNMWKQLKPGDKLWLKRRSVAGMVLATITAHQMDGAGGDTFLISCSDLVLANSVILRVAQQHRYLFTGNSAGALCGGYSYIDWTRESGLCEMRVSTDLFDTSTRLWKTMRRAVTLNSITINVSTPYTGTDTAPVLTLQSRAVDLTTWNGSTLVSRDIVIDLKTAGVRTIGPSAGTPLGADSLAGWNAYLSGPEVMIWAAPTVSGDLGANAIIGDSANTPNQAVMPQVAITWTFTPVVS